MPKFGKQSLDRLATCHPDLQKVMNEAIKHYDFTVLYGYRTTNEQFELYKKGRTFQNGKWVKIGATVTNLDGKTKLSNHNYRPSTTIDIAPYPIDWNNTDRFEALVEVIKKVAKIVGVEKERVIPAIEEVTEQKLVTEAVLDEEGNVVTEAVYETVVVQEAKPESIEKYTETETQETGEVTKNVKYSVIYMMMLKGMQEQQEIINDLKARIEALESK